MSLTGKKNQYFGVNANANSWLQANRKWRSFHTNHITDITRAVNAQLPPGYMALTEESLQIETTTPNPDTEPDRATHYPRPDATIFDTQFRQPTNQPSDVEPVGIITPTIEAMNLDKTDLNATVIYDLLDNGEIGRQVARIELLSPTNKPPYSGAHEYEQSRNTALKSGVALIEIDYLHTQPSVNPILPDYPTGEGSHPYSVTVSDPRPSIYQGKTQTIPFDVDQPIPTFDIPLDYGEKVPNFNLGEVYDYTFENSPLLQQKANYVEFPVDLDTYSRKDQMRIQERLAMITAMSDSKLDEEGPFPIDHDVIGYIADDDMNIDNDTRDL